MSSLFIWNNFMCIVFERTCFDVNHNISSSVFTHTHNFKHTCMWKLNIILRMCLKKTARFSVINTFWKSVFSFIFVSWEKWEYFSTLSFSEKMNSNDFDVEKKRKHVPKKYWDFSCVPLLLLFLIWSWCLELNVYRYKQKKLIPILNRIHFKFFWRRWTHNRMHRFSSATFIFSNHEIRLVLSGMKRCFD